MLNRASFLYSVFVAIDCAYQPSLDQYESSTKTPSVFSDYNPSKLLLKESTREELPSVTEKEKHQQNLRLGSTIVRSRTREVLQSDPTLAGSIVRLAFHDATTRDIINCGRTTMGGPNGSIQYEIEGRNENRGLSRPMKVVHSICNEVSDLEISLADTIALSGAAAVECSGGPEIKIRLGRKDATEPDPAKIKHPVQMQTERSKVETTLPSAGLDSDGLRLYFQRLGLSEAEWVALCGAHDLGRHITLLNMPKSCLKNLTRECLEDAPVSIPFVTKNPDTLSNVYYQKLLEWNDRKIELGEVAFIPTDVDMVVDAGLRKYVERYAKDEQEFFRNFRIAYQKLVDVSATTKERY